MHDALAYIRRFLFCTTLVLSLVSCSAESRPLDPKSYWLHEHTCDAPCWEGITPGETTVAEAEEILNQRSDILQPADSFDFPPDAGVAITAWSYNSVDSSWYVQIVYEADKGETVQAIHFRTPDLCLTELIREYGKPDYLVLPIYRIIAQVSVLWVQEGIVFESSYRLSDPKQGVTRSTCGGVANFFPAGTPPTETDIGHIYNLDENDFAPWEGFGNHYGEVRWLENLYDTEG